jgi:hypothetical protein
MNQAVEGLPLNLELEWKPTTCSYMANFKK